MSSSLHEISISDPARILDRLAAFYVKISEYRRQDRFTNVKIVCRDGRTFRCHRMALAAASEYFDAMFSTKFLEGRSDQDVHLRNIDGGSFEMILEYVYSGKVVPIDDDNVYPLLFASDFLMIPDIEKHCTHYLTEKNIPMDHALSIYVLASRLGKQTIKSATGQFILQHLGHFCHNPEFLSIPLDYLSPVLKHINTSTESKEKALLNVIFQWVSNLTGMGGENMGSCLMELTQQVRFEFMSHWDIETYFNRKIHASRFNLEGDAGMSTDSEDLNFIAEKKELSIHAFFEHDGGMVYSLRGTDEQAEWYVSSSFDDVIEMRVVEMNGLLYSLKRSEAQGWTFSSSTNVDLRTNQVSLALPLLNTTPEGLSRENTWNDLCCTVYMFNFRHHIYLFGLHEKYVPFQYYNTERDTWSVIQNVTSNELRPTRMVSDNNRIYMIMRQTKEDGDFSYVFRAYDPRIGRLEALNFPGMISFANAVGLESCFHQNKMYVASIQADADGVYEPTNTLYLSSYDPLADEWNVLNMGSRTLWYDVQIRRLVSDNRKLWIFGHSYSETEEYILSYDSFMQNWDTTGYSARNIHLDAVTFIEAIAF